MLSAEVLLIGPIANSRRVLTLQYRRLIKKKNILFGVIFRFDCAQQDTSVFIHVGLHVAASTWHYINVDLTL